MPDGNEGFNLGGPGQDRPTVGGLSSGQTVFGFLQDGTRVRLGVGINAQGRITLFDFETGQALAGVGGQFVTQDNQVFEIDQQGNLISAPRSLTKTERDTLGLGVAGTAGAAPGAGAVGGGGGGGRSFAEDIGLLERQQAYGTAEREAAQEFQLRQQRISDVMELTRALGEMQLSARQTAMQEMGRSPFRGAIMARGGVPLGRDPHIGLRGQLMEFAGTPIEPVGAQAGLPELEAAVAERQRVMAGYPTAPPGVSLGRQPLGMAYGGIIDMERTPDGSYSMQRRGLSAGQTGTGVLVGEGREGEGLRAGTAEVVEMMPDGRLRFIPIAGAAQAGGMTGGTALSRAQSILPMWESLGLSRVPIGTRYPTGFGGMQREPTFGAGMGWPTPDPSQAAETFGALGTRPRLIFEPNQGVFLYGEPSGELRTVGTANDLVRLGLDPKTAVTMSAAEIREMGYSATGAYGGTQVPRRLEEAPLFGQETGQFGPRDPLFMPLTEEPGDIGFYLPDPRLLASKWHTWDPDTQRMVLDALDVAGMSPEQSLRRMQFFTPTGTAGRGLTAALR